MTSTFQPVLLLCLFLLLSGCMKKWYPSIGATLGGAAGSAGGPAGAAGGAALGALAGEVAQGDEDLREAKETIEALTTGDVEALVEKGMEKHATGFDEFTATVKRTLLTAAGVLVAYLLLPVLVAQRTAASCSKKLCKDENQKKGNENGQP